MNPRSLAQAERQAFAAMKADPNCQTHRAWIAARREVEARVRSTGAVVEHHSPSAYTVFSLGYFDTLHARTFQHGRLP